MAVQVKQAFGITLKFTFAAGLVAWVISKGAIDFSALKRLGDPMTLLVSIGLVTCMLFVNNFRWLVLLRSQGIDTTVAKTFPLTLIGLFFNFALPGGVGGDVLKGFYLAKDHREKRLAALVSILMDRIVGLGMMLCTAGVALSFSWDKVAHSTEMRTLARSVFLVFAAFVAGLLLCLSNVLINFKPAIWFFEKAPGGKIFERIYRALHSYRTKPKALLAVFALSFFSQFNVIVFFFMIGRVMGFTDIPFLAYCFLVPIGLVVTSLPLAPGGIGIGQTAFLFLFNLYLARPNQLGPTAITALQIAQFALGLFGAYFYLRRGKPSPSAEALS